MSESLYVLAIWVLITFALIAIAPMYRATLVFAGKNKSSDFPRGQHTGPAWYQRTMDASANSLENMVLFIAILLICMFSARMAWLDSIAYYFLAARIGQIVAHLFSVNALMVNARFVFWLIQVGLLLYVLIKVLIQ